MTECQEKFNLSYHVPFAYYCKQLVGFEGKDVLEVGGSLPKDFVLDYLNVKSWSAIETPDYETSLRDVGGSYHQGTIIQNINDCSGMDFKNRELGEYNLFWENIENLTPEYYEKYDLVFSIAAFEHINKFPSALEKMFLALKPGGQLYSLFSPIWSSPVGHHIPNLTDKQGKSFDFANSPIPPWGHLLMRPPELCEYLYQFTDKETADLMVYYVYNSPWINRLFAEDYVAFINQSAFTVNCLEPMFESQIKEETLLALQKLYPRMSQFTNLGILAILLKD